VRLRGIKLDKVDTVIHAQPYLASAPHLRNKAAAIRHAREMKEWIDSTADLYQTLGSYPTGEKVSDAWWRTLAFNREREGVDATPNLQESFKSWKKACSLGLTAVEAVISEIERQDTLTLPSDQNLMDRIIQYSWIMGKVAAMTTVAEQERKKGKYFETAFNRFCFGRKYFRSQRGYLGWVPCTAQQGDIIVLFEDCSLPFVLRHETIANDEEGGIGERYRVIGDAYIYGCMYSRPEPPFDSFEII
jgi:hypothetical protein